MLPASGVTGEDVDAVKFTQTLRGYKTSEVDWVLDRLGPELDLLRGELSSVRAAAPPTRPTTPRHAETSGARVTGRTTADPLRLRSASRAAPIEIYRDYHDKEWGRRCTARWRCSSG